jgi:hypothetical protein
MSDNIMSPDPMAMARGHVHFGPVPNWMVPTVFETSYLGSDPESGVVVLLFDTQVHLESREKFVRQALRFETAQAAENHIQECFEFDFLHQEISFHSFLIRRGKREINLLDLEKARYLLKEDAGKRGTVSPGLCAIILAVENARAGDILDFSYTVKSIFPLLADHAEDVFKLPVDASVGTFHYSVLFSASRTMKRQCSSPAYDPVETREGGLVRWDSVGKNYLGPKTEPNMPGWYVNYDWVQISDLEGWPSVTERVSRAWTSGGDDPALGAILQDIRAQSPDLPMQVELAIRFVQDLCQHEADSRGLGERHSTPVSETVRRRSGDGVALAFVLAGLLSKLNVPARPVLVHSTIGRSISGFLPSLWLLNHAVVEFELEGRRIWVDPTLSSQGGGPLRRVVPSYGVGLKMDAGKSELVEAPASAPRPVHWELREHVLLDTTDAPSLMEVQCVAEGADADACRRLGPERVAEQRLENMVKRYGEAKRLHPPLFKDDRETNVILMADSFEVKTTLVTDADKSGFWCPLPNWIADVLISPDNGGRKTPFAITPHPCDIVYIVDVDSKAIFTTGAIAPYVHLKGDGVEFSRDDKVGPGYVILKFTLKTLAEQIAADLVGKFGQMAAAIQRESGRQLAVQKDHRRPVPGDGFGTTLPKPPDSAMQLSQAKPPPAILVVTDEPLRFGKKGRRPRGPGRKIPTWLKIVGSIFIIAWLLLLRTLLLRP